GFGGALRVWDLSEEAARIRELARLGQADRAASAYEKALQAHPNDPSLCLEWGQWQARQGEWTWAESNLARAVRLRDQDGFFLSMAADFFRRRGTDLARQGKSAEARRRWGQAQEMYERLLTVQPRHPRLDAEFTDLLFSSAGDWKMLKPLHMTSANGATLTPQPDGSVLVGGKNPDTDTLTFEALTPLRKITGLRLEVLADPSLPSLGPGRAGNLILSKLQVTTASASAKPAVAVLKHAFATFSDPTGHVNFAIKDHDPRFGWSIWPRTGESHTAYFESRESTATPEG